MINSYLISVIIYILTIAITVFFTWNYEKKADTKLKKILLFLTIIAIPVIISTFRYKVGIDFDNYKEYYDIILRRFHAGEKMPPQFEIGFIIVNLIAYFIFNNAQGAFFLISLMFVVFSIGGIIKFKDKISIPIATLIFMTFYYSASFNGARQLLAGSIVFYGLSYLLNKKYLKYFFFVIFACLFHKTAMIAFLFYFLVPKEKNKLDYYDKKFNICVMLSIILLPLIKKIMELICNNLNFYSSYFSIEPDRSIYFLLYILPPLTVLLLFRKRIIEKDSKNLFWIRLMILQLPLQFAGCFIAYIDRLSLYVSISQIIIMSLLYKEIEGKYKTLIKIFIIVWYIFYYVFVYIFLNGNGVYPYNFRIGL